jgi:hypothetical protein
VTLFGKVYGLDWDGVGCVGWGVKTVKIFAGVDLDSLVPVKANGKDETCSSVSDSSLTLIHSQLQMVQLFISQSSRLICGARQLRRANLGGMKTCFDPSIHQVQ